MTAQSSDSQEPCGGVGAPYAVGGPTTTATEGPGPVLLTEVVEGCRLHNGAFQIYEGGSMFTREDRQAVQHALDSAIKLDLHAQSVYAAGGGSGFDLAGVDSPETKVRLRGTSAFAEALLYMMDYDERPTVTRDGKRVVRAEFDWTHPTLAGNEYPLHIILVKV